MAHIGLSIPHATLRLHCSTRAVAVAFLYFLHYKDFLQRERGREA